ncbi:MAG: family 20 glycosylhydrolase [Puniceicoccales bacterium]|jgi:hypothetical protein|nr:family 20 glycosylhydrolase [Puniceicoccales bacterium]
MDSFDFLFPRVRKISFARADGKTETARRLSKVVVRTSADFAASPLAAMTRHLLEKAQTQMEIAASSPRPPRLPCIGGATASAEFPPEHYRLEVGAGGALIEAADASGVHYGAQTLAQILREADKAGGAVPALVVEDGPDFPVRGFMLDISRCKVPTRETLLDLVPRLAALRINQLQLYTEHTFAFPGHEAVWRDASPMTADELRELDQLCLAHGIELVPNLQSFGHCERWLKHAPYRHLAECPDGFFHALANAHRPAGTLRPCQDSLDFAAALYDAYLPNFSSKQLNIGGDEPWELGLGRSKEVCEKHGRHTVYREHLRGLAERVAERGKTMQFWADILLEEPEHASEAPAGATPILWGYDAGHPFDAQCASLRGRPFLVAPGVSSWQTFHGRLANALANTREALAAAAAHGAQGMLATAWGDNGNHQPWWTFYPALTAAAALAWGRDANVEVAAGDGSPQLVQVVADVFLDGDARASAEIIARGGADRFFKTPIRNKSTTWELLFCAPESAASETFAKSTELAELEAWLDEREGGGDGETAAGKTACELAAARALERLALARARLLRGDTGGQTAARATAREKFAALARETLALYERAWLLRARTGGLAESLQKITDAISATLA